MGKLKSFCLPDKENDLLIHLGDVGIYWDDSRENREFTDWFLSRDYNIAFLDGNHENFDRLMEFPEEEWNGGRVQRISGNAVHLMRGQIYTLEGQSFFCMGGCRSSAHWKAEKPWWEQEMPSRKEFDAAYNNLKAHDLSVDYILTHKYFTPQQQIQGEPIYSVEALHEFIDNNVKFKRWYSGHWHDTYTIDEKHEVVFTEPVKLI